MLFGFLLTVYTLNCVLLVLLVLIQQGKGGLGIGSIGGSSQLLFGGSGGQDIFQKATWTLGAIYMFGSLGLSLMRTHEINSSLYIRNIEYAQPINPIQQAPELPSDQ